MPSPWFQSVPDRLLYPPLSGHTTANVIVVGGGLLGIFTAWQLVKEGYSVVLLEKKHLGTGTTGSSLGIMTRMPHISSTDLAEDYGFDLGARFYSAYSLAQKELFELIEKEAIDCDFLKVNSYAGSFDKATIGAKKEWKILERIGNRVSWVDEATASNNALPFTNAVRFIDEATGNPRALLFLLLAKIDKNKLRVYEESEVIDIEVGDKIAVATIEGSVIASQLILATEAPPIFFGELDVLTRPVIMRSLALSFEKSPLPRGIFWDIASPHFCIRSLDERTVIMEMEKQGRRDLVRASLEEMLANIFQYAPTIEDSWSGGVLKTRDGLPYVFDHPHYRGRIFVALGFSKNSMVGGFLASQVLKALVTKAYHPAKNILDLYRTGTKLKAPKTIKKRRAKVEEEMATEGEKEGRTNYRIALAERLKRRLGKRKWIIVFALVETITIVFYLGWVYWSSNR